MELRLDDAQVDLQQTVARLCQDRFPLDAVAAREAAPVDRGHWTEMASLGVFGLLLDEAAGGSGLGVVEAAIVFEQLGSHLAPGPALWTVLAAGSVPGAATGEVLVAGLEAEAIRDGAATVEHGAEADALLVLGADGVVLHRAADLPAPVALEPLDPLTPVARVAGLAAGGERVVDADRAASLRRLGTVLAAATLAGVADRALQVARAYALEREQFDRPIGAFQAVQHLLADMYVRATLAQSAVYAAAAVVQDPGTDDPDRAAGGAKLLAAEAAIANASTAVQVLGGMGFTWDMLPNHLLKRGWVLEQAFGARDHHALERGALVVAEGSGTR
jgi:alkylation response protein AidB-like acyl-CoA dehydrogenase